MLITSETKAKCVNFLILVFLVFFASITGYLIYLLAQNGLLLMENDNAVDVVLSTVILAGWVGFILAVMTKAIHIYAKLPKTKLW